MCIIDNLANQLIVFLHVHAAQSWNFVFGCCQKESMLKWIDFGTQFSMPYFSRADLSVLILTPVIKVMQNRSDPVTDALFIQAVTKGCSDFWFWGWNSADQV